MLAVTFGVVERVSLLNVNFFFASQDLCFASFFRWLSLTTHGWLPSKNIGYGGFRKTQS